MVVISGHWEEDRPTASNAQSPELIYDYSGFPPETYQLTWPAPGAPELAEKVGELLLQAGLPVGPSVTRGYDHGVFVPLKVAFPEANIPVLALSLASSLDPGLHLAVGGALAPLRDEGALIIGSGMSFHNLRALFAGGALERSREFDGWLAETVESPVVQRDARLTEWKNAPYATFAHPREEHLIPLMRWNLREADADRVHILEQVLIPFLGSDQAIRKTLAKLLVLRGIDSPESAADFLSPSIDRLHSPYLLAGMKVAIERLNAAIERKEGILIYGDYDVDGTTAVVILKTVIELCGGEADFHVPHRIREGYDLRGDVIERAAAAGIRLVISVDTGTRAFAAAESARRVGMRTKFAFGSVRFQ